ncbi:MAG: sugar transferase [Chitinophagaceae bacterium]|nr:sugar transferase [Chitinophagaceae bacterium]
MQHPKRSRLRNILLTTTNPRNRFLKRIIDILIATIALILLPIAHSFHFILWFTGEHEVFYFQKRVGIRTGFSTSEICYHDEEETTNIGTGKLLCETTRG